jgi:uncharacterized membrane protein YoaK (UPF0700 family)
MTGNLTLYGFELRDAQGWTWLVIVVAYFSIGGKIAGGTIWDRILRIARPQPSASFAKRVLAMFLDFFTIFFLVWLTGDTIHFLAGYLIAWLTGNLTPDGLHLSGAPAVAMFALIGAYYYACWKIAGTVSERILGITRF